MLSDDSPAPVGRGFRLDGGEKKNTSKNSERITEKEKENFGSCLGRRGRFILRAFRTDMAAKRASAPMGTYEYYKFIADEGLTTMKHLLSEGAFQNEWIDTGVDAQVGMNTFEREWEGSELKIYLGRKILDVPYSILAKLLHEADETQYKTWDENCAEFTVRFFY